MTNQIQNSKLKRVFMGTPEISAIVLESLINSDYKPFSVVTRPDKPTKRSKEPQESPVKTLAQENGIALFQPNTKLELEDYICSEKPDLIVVAAFGMIITKKTLEVPKFGAINVHPSLLPKYRGPWPIGAPILNGDAKTGTTTMLMSEGMDEGDVLTQVEIPLTGHESTPELTDILANLSTKLLLETLPEWINGHLTPRRQDDSQATYTKMAKKEDGHVDWSKQSADEIERMSRAYQDWPGTFTFWNDKKIDLYDISILAETNLGAGEVSMIDSKLAIGTKNGAISPAFLKIEGKNKVTSADFLRGYPDFIGSNLK
jgi:methionyl-tRNA formyltransferase